MTIDLKGIRARADAATPGPWRAHARLTYGKDPRPDGRCDGITAGESPYDPPIVVTDSGVYEPAMPDAEFIAHARADVPALLDLVDAMAVRLAAALDLVLAGEWDTEYAKLDEVRFRSLYPTANPFCDYLDGHACPRCGAPNPKELIPVGCEFIEGFDPESDDPTPDRPPLPIRHLPGCPIDSFLTRAGFPDQASRDAERARRAKR